MSYSSPTELIFKTPNEAKAFAKWFLGTNITSSFDDEFQTTEEKDQHYQRRALRLELQVDNLRGLNIITPNKTTYTDQTMFKLCKKDFDPLSTIGSDKKSSRFNYKEATLFKNRTLYFGQDKDCCYSELFHSEFMSLCYPQFQLQREGEIPRPKYKLYEFKISVPNILVITSPPTFKALGVSEGVLKDEWFELNYEYDIPAASQILAAIARARGFSGILYSSVRHQTKNNLVLFEENISDLSQTCRQVSDSDFDLDSYERSVGLRHLPINSGTAP